MHLTFVTLPYEKPRQTYSRSFIWCGSSCTIKQVIDLEHTPMAHVADSKSADSERAELDAVLAVLARNPRLAKLLKFLAERALQGRAEEINEYTIATEVFDRSKSTFDGSTDSI